jgi:hypothetical protein
MVGKQVEDFVRIMASVGSALGFVEQPWISSYGIHEEVSFLGSEKERSMELTRRLNEINNFVVSNTIEDTREIRLAIVEMIPVFLMQYQALRFPVILTNDRANQLPTKADLSRFPEVIYETGLFVPVSACLRLIAVSLIDHESKVRLLESGNLKTIVSHMVDDPLNPFQRESAVFVVNVLTRDFEEGQRAVASVMTPPREVS